MVGSIIAQNVTPYGHLEASGHRIANAELIFPGVRGKLKKTITAEDGAELKSGTAVIIQPLDRDKADATPTFIITPYKNNKENKRSNQPETHRDITTEKSYTVKISNPDRTLSFNNEHFRRSDDVLFPTPDSPSLEEIKQCRIPDCFLLAAMQAVINHPDGKAFIRGAMRQNDDGTTTVRLFDPETLQPEYFRVETSVIVDGLGELNQHRARWVDMLEKAFAARGKKNLKTTNASVSSVYSGGGQTHFALQSLTGIAAESFSTKARVLPLQIDQFLNEETHGLLKILLGLPEVRPAQITNYLAMLKPFQLTAIYTYFGVTEGDEAAKLQALTNYAELIKCQYADPDLYQDALQKQSVAKLQAKHPAAAAILSAIFIKTASFSGYYDPHQLKLYQTISDGLAAGKLVTAGTPKKFEEKVTGIVSRHAYTVLDVFEKQMQVKDENGQPKTINARFVQLRNPWGDARGMEGVTRDWLARGVGRVYKQHSETLDIKVENTNDAVFLVELADFCRYYADFDISASANEAFQRDAKKEKCIAEVTGFIHGFAIDFTSSNSDLIDANTDYQQQWAQLIQIEFLELDRLDRDLIDSINAIFNERFETSLERSSVHGLLNENLFPTVSGTAEQVKDHVYHLLKLNWLKSQETPDKELEAELIDAIQQHGTSQPELWENLSVVKTKLNMVMMTRINNYADIIDYMLDLGAKLQRDMKAFKLCLKVDRETDPALIDGLMQTLINNFINLEQLYYQFLSLEVVAENFDYAGNNQQYLANFAAIIQKCEKFIKPMIETKPLFRELWKDRDEILVQAADMAQKHVLTSKEHKRVEDAVGCVFSGKMKKVGDELLASTSEAKQKLGAKLIKADSLAKKIHHAFNRVGIFFSRTASFFGGLFQRRNSYELPPVAEERSTHRVGKSA